jgi:hypothetical protein
LQLIGLMDVFKSPCAECGSDRDHL